MTQTIQTLSATEARNRFFELLKISYLQNKAFLIEKGGIPMVYIGPIKAKMKKSNKKMMSKEEYRKFLLELDTSWFTKDDYKDYLKTRRELDERAKDYL